MREEGRRPLLPPSCATWEVPRRRQGEPAGPVRQALGRVGSVVGMRAPRRVRPRARPLALLAALVLAAALFAARRARAEGGEHGVGATEDGFAAFAAALRRSSALLQQRPGPSEGAKESVHFENNLAGGGRLAAAAIATRQGISAGAADGATLDGATAELRARVVAWNALRLKAREVRSQLPDGAGAGAGAGVPRLVGLPRGGPLGGAFGVREGPRPRPSGTFAERSERHKRLVARTEARLYARARGATRRKEPDDPPERAAA